MASYSDSVDAKPMAHLLANSVAASTNSTNGIDTAAHPRPKPASPFQQHNSVAASTNTTDGIDTAPHPGLKPASSLPESFENGSIQLPGSFINHMRSNIIGLYQINEPCEVHVVATINRIETYQHWYYMECICCGFIRDSECTDSYFCPTCATPLTDFTTRYKVYLNAIDGTGETIFTLYCREMTQLIGKTAEELRVANRNLLGEELFPAEFGSILHRTLLFKLKISSYDIHYPEIPKIWHVKRISHMSDVISIHYALLKRQEEVYMTLVGSGKDVSPIFMPDEEVKRHSPVKYDKVSGFKHPDTSLKRDFLDLEDDSAVWTEYPESKRKAVAGLFKKIKTEFKSPPQE